jgi:hypothetical protein
MVRHAELFQQQFPVSIEILNIQLIILIKRETPKVSLFYL